VVFPQAQPIVHFSHKSKSYEKKFTRFHCPGFAYQCQCKGTNRYRKSNGSRDGATLAGVSILVKGTSTGTSTDADGKFSINLPDRSAVLVVSFIGFATRRLEWETGR